MKIVQLHEWAQKQCLNPSPTPKNSPSGPQKVKNDPKIKSKSNVRIKRNTENESCSTTRVHPKTIIELYPKPKKAHKGPKK